ncbi:thiamine phosphate synthase [Planctomicrobium sp. SH668]|uniref:thiamine phosphate synthase n=1 Tax=Planctomicrobium sp. SH668 TaxID=3448126 RepID=UPI003F5C7A13
MSELNVTAGVERTLTTLQQFAGEQGMASLYKKLLHSLLESEGRATELLRDAGVTVDDAERLPQEQSSAEEIPFPEWKRTLLRKADSVALDAENQGPTGTEHLLVAASLLDPQTAAILAKRGLTEQRLRELIATDIPQFSGLDEAIIQVRPAGAGAIDEASLYRILDASANRAREGLRVVEDYVRFRLNDALISRELKAIRHQLTESLRHLGQAAWVPFRDTLNDVGTLGSLASERQRGILTDVVRANLKRIEESLRSLEEFSKLLDSAVSLKISECRYRIYTVEKSLESLMRNQMRLTDCQLYLLLTASLCRYGVEETLKHSIEKGVGIVQIREKGLTDRELVHYGEQVKKWVDGTGVILIMNDRPDLAAAIGADGVHLGQDDLSVSIARQVMGGNALIGVSTHNPEQARAAVFDGADYLGVGPVFETTTKSFDEYAGLNFVRYVAEDTCLPWFAIGGIHGGNLDEVIAAGATRVAVSSAICRSPHPRGVTAEMVEKLRRATSRMLPSGN